MSVTASSPSSFYFLSKKLIGGLKKTLRNSSQLTSIAASSRVSANKQEGKPGVFPSISNSADDDSNHTRSVTIDKFVLCKESNRIVPSIEIARLLPLSVREASNEVLLILAAQGNDEACAEVLTRHIMSHDDVSYTEAEIKLKVIRRAHRNSMKPSAYFHLAVGSVAAIAGVASFPMVFDVNTVSFFNEHFVTDDIPSAEALQTTLEVGAWSWTWMEPIMGQLSFFILCLQFAYTEYNYIGLHHFHHTSKVRMAKTIAQQFPQYNEAILVNFCMSQKFFMHKE
jgi:hypothetical protein